MKKRKILVADDDESIQFFVKRALSVQPLELVMARDGVEAIHMAEEEKPDLIILDICMPKMDGKEVIKKLRRNPQTQMIPIMMLTGSGELVDKIVGFELGADDYLTKPFEREELRVRIQSIFRRNNRDISANPLTRLPGSPVIEEYVSEKIRSKKPFALFYIDVDNFKAFNDVYGYTKGDQVIQETAGILLESLKSFGRANDLLGHIGGDDFVIVTSPDCAESLAMAITKEYDLQAPTYYNPEDRTRGNIITKDRQGNEKRFPLMALSIAIATTEKRKFSHYAKAVDIVSEIKHFLKTKLKRKGSAYLIDRRNDRISRSHHSGFRHYKDSANERKVA